MGDVQLYITAQGPRLGNDLYCVEWDVKLLLYHTIPGTTSTALPSFSHDQQNRCGQTEGGGIVVVVVVVG